MSLSNLFTTLTSLLLLLLGSGFVEHAHCELFTALVHMEGLLSLETDLLTSLQSYIHMEKERINNLEKFADRVKRAHSLTPGDSLSSHLYNPVNAFQLVNRYSNGWMELHNQLYEDNAKDLMANISMNNYRLPSSEDMTGAIVALRRLQDTYNVKSADLANGELGKDESLNMTAYDCYMIGRQAYTEEHWLHTREWMLECLNKFDKGDTEGIDLSSVYDHLSFAEYSLGNVRKASQYTRDLLQNEPNHDRALSNMEYFQNIQYNEPEKFVDAEVPQSIRTERLDVEEKESYEALCREGRPLPSKDHHKLICYYYDAGRNPRLVIRPIKVEVAHPDPKIYVFRDIISPNERARLIELAAPRLNRATVHDSNGNLVHANYRISKSGWLGPEDDPFGYVNRIDQRIEDVTGLTMETAEMLQVVNYGIGGHYEPHYDFAQRHEEEVFPSLGTGNRIATVLFYLTDVELGGATVFPELGARIAPSIGDASFWWNLHKSGDGDLRTRHAGCPVLVGTKWVCNKWIHERGQEFRRPCSLSPDE